MLAGARDRDGDHHGLIAQPAIGHAPADRATRVIESSAVTGSHECAGWPAKLTLRRPPGSRGPGERQERYDHRDSAASGRRRSDVGDTLTVTDNRTGKQYEIPIEDGTIRATELRKIKTDDDDFGLMTYDPAYMAPRRVARRSRSSTASRGILEYRGYPIEQLAEKSTLPRGRLPADPRRAADAASSSTTGTHEITIHTFVHENVKEFMQGFRYDAHPMGMLLGVGRRAVDVLSRGGAIKDQRAPLPADHPPDREDADAGRVLLPPQPRHAVRLSRQRPQLRRATSSR